MRTQMVPVATITDRLHRAVRDLSRTLGKDVRWEVEGEQTELERNVLHQLADSLLHVVRNAVDHGIESPEERLAAGKPSYGDGAAPRHAARFRGDHLGRRRRARHRRRRACGRRPRRPASTPKGSPTTRRCSSSSAPECRPRQLAVADLRSRRRPRRRPGERRCGARSGRDPSERGAGNELRLVVPITLAVLPCLLVDAGGQRFAVPLHRVVVVQAGDVATFHGEGRVVLWLDGEPVPVASLAELLGLPDEGGASGPIIVVRGAARTATRSRSTRWSGHRDVGGQGAERGAAAARRRRRGERRARRFDPARPRPAGPHRSGPPRPPGGVAPAPHAAGEPADVRGHVLVVDDALTVRELAAQHPRTRRLRGHRRVRRRRGARAPRRRSRSTSS